MKNVIEYHNISAVEWLSCLFFITIIINIILHTSYIPSSLEYKPHLKMW